MVKQRCMVKIKYVFLHTLIYSSFLTHLYAAWTRPKIRCRGRYSLVARGRTNKDGTYGSATRINQKMKRYIVFYFAVLAHLFILHYRTCHIQRCTIHNTVIAEKVRMDIDRMNATIPDCMACIQSAMVHIIK